MICTLRCLLLTLLLLCPAARAQDPSQGVGFQQKPGAQIPLDLAVIDEEGRPQNLVELLGGKPAILELGYYTCPMLCGQVRSGLLDTLRSLAPERLAGRDFEVVSVSIDPRERSFQARAKQHEAETRLPGAKLHYTVATPGEIVRLTDAVGFSARFDRRTEQFAHPAGLVFVTGDGVVASYLFGISFSGPAVSRALGAAGEKKIADKVDAPLFLCFQYDPHTGRYSLNILRVVQMMGVGTVLMVAAAVLYFLRQERRRA